MIVTTIEDSLLIAQRLLTIGWQPYEEADIQRCYGFTDSELEKIILSIQAIIESGEKI